MNRKQFTLSRIIIFILMLFLAISTVFPFYFMLSSSLKTSKDYYTSYFSLPKLITFQNYINLFKTFNIGKMMFNSMLVNVTTVILSTLIITMAAYIFAKFPYKGSDKIFKIIVGCMMIPPIVLLIPVYLLMSKLHLINNYFSLILFYTAIISPFSLYLVTSNFKSIPDECIDSARIDGAGLFTIYYKIILPLGKPVILTLITVNFLWCWNEFLYSMLLLQTNELRTLTVGTALIVGRHTIDMPLMLTGLLANSIPVLIVFIAANKYFVKGLTAGAVKE